MQTVHPYQRFGGIVAALTLAFIWPLGQWLMFAVGSGLYSHVLLVPLASIGMVWLRKASPEPSPRPARIGALLAGLLSAATLGYALLVRPSPALEPHHRLTWMAAAYVLAVVATGFWCLGGRFMRTHAVPVGFLAFMVPMPGWLERATEIALQRGSAEAADIFFSLSGLPYLRDGQVFRLPSITMEIAQECSGIHSSLVLFITSIVAGQVLLRPGWRRWTLSLAVIPLALLRNGFRVLTLGVLCERIGPHMIKHWIHHSGGPIFFALSLIPFFALLLVLARVGQPHASKRATATLVADPKTSTAPK